MKKSNVSKPIVLLLVLLAGLSQVAFGAGEGEKKDAGTAAPVAAAPAAGPKNFLAKYEPAITQTAWRFLNNGIQFKPGDTIEKNVYIDRYRDDMGINLKYAWAVPEEQFDQKMNISIASGDLPDIMWLKNKQLIDLAENGDLYDLTEVFKNNTSQDTQSILQQDMGAFNTAKVGGRLMAVPHTASTVDSMQVLYVRTDWLKKLNLQMPKTMQELVAVAEAFATKDPDGNGKNDSFGIAFTKNCFKPTENHAAAVGFFAAYHAYNGRWVKDASGNLGYGSIQPEARAALTAMADLYKRGLIDPEFGVKDRPKVTETVTSGKVGIVFGNMSTPLSFLKNNAILDPNADWMPMALVSADGKPAAPIARLNVTRYYAVNRKNKNPEALMKMLEAGTKGYLRGDKGDTPENQAKYGVTPDGISVWQYQIIGYEPAHKNLNAHNYIIEAFKKNDASYLNAEEKGYYDKIVKYRTTGDKNFWGEERVFGTPSSFDVVGKHVADNSYIMDGFYGAYTPTMVEKFATLQAMEEEVFTKIVMGQSSIDAFDKFVADWKNLGGTQITKEVNDWYKRNK